jgi:hypothetical protein
MRFLPILALLLATRIAFAQTQNEAIEQKDAKPYVTASARLMGAKTAYVKDGGGSEIPFNVIESGLEGWGRFTLVDSPQQADIIIEVESPEEDTGTSVSSSTDAGGHSSTTSSRDITVAIIKVIVYDARTHLPLWTANERPKGGFKEKTRDDNLVKSAELLVSRFRDRLEPPPAEPAIKSNKKQN